MKQQVYIPVLYKQGIKKRMLAEVCTGLEEEGVPFLCLCVAEAEEKAEKLGRRAALMSPLQVGIGVDADGGCAICHEKLAQHPSYITTPPGNGRIAGQNAARLVKGLPLLYIRKE
ncbi:glycerol dehydratase reactivase beta/small subunit family protein [Aneurinibacillus thermoaerophilus]|uniref:glycerol dehydratase reactivase beta/small subunit family protein n=1 Tax=Aneurinibacillus thermoaerophilus TaxID=143495 RepID=UPI002E1E6E3A|nr:glycerol dehydratase reactivase beta/small subunit family protein [Aneurinibacillus thermoaerophilus]MED0764172.1 glycerol dehydratase reactivase beta/small subunit family protein [Aneurinibacillus thermoaerophilus]